MARAGRKAKQGKREPNGRLSRKQKSRVVFDQGTDVTRAKMSVYGTDGSDAIGRAFVTGLLGEHGEVLRDTARSIHRAYWPMLCVGPVAGTLGDKSADAGGARERDVEAEERQLTRERWLTETLCTVDRLGRNVRRAFDQLCIDINPDCGPGWLDRLVVERGLPSDLAQLKAALKALRVLAAQHAQAPGIQGSNDGETNLNLWLEGDAS